MFQTEFVEKNQNIHFMFNNLFFMGKAMANYPQELAQDAVYQSHTGHMTGLWFLPARPPRLNTNEWMNLFLYIEIRAVYELMWKNSV